MSYYRLPGFNTKCTKCPLGVGKAVPAQAECLPKDIVLFVVSAYPGSLELSTGITLAPSNKEKKSQDKGMGGGEFLRMCLRAFFDGDPNFPEELKPFEERVWFSKSLSLVTLVIHTHLSFEFQIFN